MKIRYLLTILCGCVCFFAVVVLAAETLWVTSDNAQLKKDATASSETIATVPIGVEVKVLSTESRWHKIQLPSGEQGWMYRGRLSDTAPEKPSEEGSGNLFGALAEQQY